MEALQIIQIDFNSPSVSKKLHDAAKNIGFAVFNNHPLNLQLVRDVFEEWKQFFATNQKHRYTRVAGQQLGYFPANISETSIGYDEKDKKEFYQFNISNNIPKGMSNKTRDLFVAIEHLAIQLLTWLENELPIEVSSKLSEPLINMINGSVENLMRIAHYPPLIGIESENAMRASPHNDINFLTILLTSSEPGLQIQDKNGNWCDIPSNKDSVVVNIGCLLETVTESYYPAIKHRVITTPERAKFSRYSIPLFLHARGDVQITEQYTADELLLKHLKMLDKGAY